MAPIRPSCKSGGATPRKPPWVCSASRWPPAFLRELRGPVAATSNAAQQRHTSDTTISTPQDPKTGSYQDQVLRASSWLRRAAPTILGCPRSAAGFHRWREHTRNASRHPGFLATPLLDPG
ncbi:hypothetical protein NDU88_001439 [Pleurodeles waltl]|uniref:Uncharacterized protein n=1 Tax=Pleurodeles waltl TaxID=8319 RepID=A0AAV7VBT4_PLEWA|nr:hypothetical protein NDU88_001439 [Pleurodeles waltl]